MRVVSLLRTHKILTISAGVYILLCLLALPFYKYWTNPDGVVYLSIAQKYSRGEFGDALNGYWGPMISWLLAPFYMIGKNPLVGARLIFMASGICSLVLSYLLLRSYKVKHWLHIVFMVSFVPLLALWTMTLAITPDTLVLTAFLLYVYLLTREDVKTQPILLGVAGAIGYYAKAYFIVFFVVHTIVLYLLNRYKDKRKEMKSSLITLSVALVLILPWIASLSLKYDKPTFSTTSTFIYKIFNPANPQGFPTDYIGLMEPPNDTALSMWEDPSYLPVKSWNPLSSMETLKIPFILFFNNVKSIGAAFLDISLLAVATLLGLMIYVLHRWQKLGHRELNLASAVAVYILGLSVALVEYRYLLPAFAGLLILSAYVASGLKVNKFKNHSFAVVIIIVIATIVISPLLQLYYRRHEQVTIFQHSNALKAFIQPGEHVASDKFDTIRYCYFLQAKCYGRIYSENDTAENQRQLEQSRVTSIIIRDGDDDWVKPDYLNGFKEIFRIGDTRLLRSERL
jgi:4-amino-4-deoxy-L-arabinose transferase-like glycosyltransferase